MEINEIIKKSGSVDSTVGSMTGFASTQFEVRGLCYRVEFKSLNHRFLEVKMLIPDYLNHLETKFQGFIRKILTRGSLRIEIKKEIASGEKEVQDFSSLGADLNRAKLFLEDFCLQNQIRSPVSLADVIQILNLLQSETGNSNNSKFEESIEFSTEEETIFIDGFLQGLSRLIESRKAEGFLLFNEIRERLVILESITKQIEVLANQLRETLPERMEARIKQLFSLQVAGRLDSERIYTESAIIMEKLDITEELVRLKSHLDSWKTMNLSEPVGRKMDFICQELLREINTVCSKCQNFEIIQLAINFKDELEKVREQSKNLE